MTWINIKERKPDAGVFVLTYHKHNGIEVSRDLNISFIGVTHWMLLPEKP